MIAKNITPLKQAPRKALPFSLAPTKPQIPHTGKNSSREAFNKAIAPQHNPNAAHRAEVRPSIPDTLSPIPCILNVSTTTHISSKVVRHISQGHRTAYCIAAGYSAQIQALQTPTRRPNTRHPIS